MKVLVMGGTRYFGKRLVHLLINRGYEVFVLSRGQVQDDFGARVTRLKADRGDENLLRTALKDSNFDVVVDQVCMNAVQAKISCDVFAGKTRNYIMTSTLSVYGFGADLKEEDYNAAFYQPRTPLNPAEEYAEGKRAAEAVFLREAAFPVAFARFPVVVGEDDYTLRLYNQVRRVQEGKPLYYPNLEARFSFITSEDAANALLWLIETKKQGPYNFASPDVLPLSEILRKIEDVTSRKAQLLDVANEEAWSPFGIPSDWYLNTEKAKSEGFECQPMKEWLGPLLEKYKNGKNGARPCF